MNKIRVHNEWFQSIVKTTCPCGQKKTTCYAWGNYVAARWRTVEHFCEKCFQSRVMTRLLAHAGPCGCVFSFQARSGHSLPAFIQEAESQCNLPKAA
jgi:hypothetical protein